MNICFPDLKVRYNKTDYIVYFPNQSEIHFVGLDEGPRTEKLLGLEFSSVYFNEASELDYSPIQLVVSRLAEKNALKKKVYFDFNPPSKVSWSYYLFIKKLDPVDEIPLAEPSAYNSLKMNPVDNLENIDSEYISLLEKMPKKERERFLEGEFGDESMGQVYYSFRLDDHVKPFEKMSGTLFSSHDFNIFPMTALVSYYIDSTFYIYDEIWLENSDTYKMCDELKKRGYSGTTAIPDSSAGNRKTSGKSDLDIMREAGMTILSTRNPFQKDRTNNCNRLFQQNKIIIHPRCKKLINDLSKVSWKDNKIDPGPQKTLGHITDCLSYLTWKLDPIQGHIQKYSMSPR
jgi:hypothetical protein